MSRSRVPGSLLAALSLLLAVPAAPAVEGIHVGGYVCAMDNCRKAFHADKTLLGACQSGMRKALETGPSSTACVKGCKAGYPEPQKAAREACLRGCTLFPKACLRRGRLPPKEHRLEIENEPRSNF